MMIDYFEKAIRDTINQVYEDGYAYVWKKQIAEEIRKDKNVVVIEEKDFWRIELKTS